MELGTFQLFSYDSTTVPWGGGDFIPSKIRLVILLPWKDMVKQTSYLQVFRIGIDWLP